jgi:hypothetical protein
MVRCTKSGRGSCWLVLRCGGCGTWHETFAPNEAVARLRTAIARGVHAIEAFTHALEPDLIGPDDFRIASDSPG